MNSFVANIIFFLIPYILFIGYSSLIWAAQNGQSDIVKMLLEYGADANSKYHGKTHI